MAKLHEQVEAEFENIERTLADIPDSDSLSNLSRLELAGLATLLNNFYNGIENILKTVMTTKGMNLPDGPSWHRDLLNAAKSLNIISESSAGKLKQYLAFRHFYIHSYSFDLDAEQMENLIKDILIVYDRFKDEIQKTIRRF